MNKWVIECIWERKKETDKERNKEIIIDYAKKERDEDKKETSKFFFFK